MAPRHTERMKMPPLMTARQKALVLLVDDCDDIRDLYVDTLSGAFEIALASTAAEALAQAVERRPGVIVMDLMLPDMRGEDAISRLRRDARTAQIPVIVVSGFTEPKQKPHPWDAYLMKPCHPDTLSACLERMLEQGAADHTGTG